MPPHRSFKLEGEEQVEHLGWLGWSVQWLGQGLERQQAKFNDSKEGRGRCLSGDCCPNIQNIEPREGLLDKEFHTLHDDIACIFLCMRDVAP